MKNNGTVPGCMAVIILAMWLGIWGAIIAVIWHFVSKFW